MLGLLEPNGLGAEAVWEQLADRSSTQHSQLLKLISVRGSITAPFNHSQLCNIIWKMHDLTFVTNHELSVYTMQMYSLSFVPSHTGGATPPHGRCRRPYNLCVWKKRVFCRGSVHAFTSGWLDHGERQLALPSLEWAGGHLLDVHVHERRDAWFLCNCRLERWEVQSLAARRKDRL